MQMCVIPILTQRAKFYCFIDEILKPLKTWFQIFHSFVKLNIHNLINTTIKVGRKIIYSYY